MIRSLATGFATGLALLATSAWATVPLTLDGYLALTGAAPNARLAYGPSPDQYVELFVPPGHGPLPVAVLIHGGCFRNALQGMPQMRGLAGRLVAQGIAVWSIEYRGVDTQGGGFPGMFRDIGAALDLLATEAPARRLDTTKLVAIGHSAGGFLALWAAGRSRIAPASPLFSARPLRVRHVIALGSPGDLRNMGTWLSESCGVDGAALTGHRGPARHDVLADTDPAELVPPGTTVVFINGDRDAITAPGLSARDAATLRRRGVIATALVSPRSNHFDEVTLGSPTWPLLRAAIFQALGRTGGS